MGPASASGNTGLGTVRSLGVWMRPSFVCLSSSFATRRGALSGSERSSGSGLPASLLGRELLPGFAGGGELVVVDALFLHAQLGEQRYRRLHHRRWPAHVGVSTGQILGVPFDDVGDQAGLAVPVVVIRRLGQRRDV